jgi:hypothetical protein
VTANLKTVLIFAAFAVLIVGGTFGGYALDGAAGAQAGGIIGFFAALVVAAKIS